MKRYRWNLLSHDDKAVLALSEAINVTLPVARALFSRGIQTFDEAKNFFRSSIEHLPSPFLLQDMKKAVERVCLAVNGHEKIMLYGDYDVDGTTGTALLFLFLKLLLNDLFQNQNEEIQTGESYRVYLCCKHIHFRHHIQSQYFGP